MDVLKAIKSLGILKSSTGDSFSFESAAEALINLSILKGEIEKAEKAIREKIPMDKLPFDGVNGKIIIETRNEYSQDVLAIYKSKQISEKEFWDACKLSKSAFNKKTEKGKTALASISLNEKIIDTKSIIKVLKNDKIQDIIINSIE